MTRLLDLSLPTAAENLALDEALLEAADLSDFPTVLRFWKLPHATVVLGRGSKVDTEVDVDACQAAGTEILRRCSGGATVVGGPGCLMYSITVDLRRQPELANVDQIHSYVMQRLQQAVFACVPESLHDRLAFQGICDLTFDNRKYSGNALRIARHHLLYHGTFLLAADLVSIMRCLKQPPRQPDYRQQRTHADFLVNLPADAACLKSQIASQFQAASRLESWPREQTEKLLQRRYGNPAWTYRHR